MSSLSLKSSGICRILIVDDSSVSRLVLLDEVKAMGHNIEEAEDGEQALAMIRRLQFDIVLLDVRMPNMSGPELLKVLREEGYLDRLIVIMVSAVGSTGVVAECIEAGAEDYLLKPIQPILLRARLRASVERKVKRDLESIYNAQTEILNHQLLEINTQLSELNNEKNEFLGIAAHDLKNPITAIRGNVHHYMEYPAEYDQERLSSMMSTIEQSCDQMHHIIINLLDINRIEAGIFKMELNTINVVPLLQQTCASYQRAMDDKKIKLNWELPSSGSIIVQGDSYSLLQIFDNLVSNAIKYSPLGTTITLVLGLREDRVQFTVRDQGPGLSELEQTKLFGKFVRLSPRPTGGEHSTGLGLSIVKRLVEMMHGRVWCESSVGAGCQFHFTLPVG